MVLSIDQILEHRPHLVPLAMDPDQFQPCGIDLKLASVARFLSSGFLGTDTKSLPLLERVPSPEGDRAYYLQPGPYLITFLEGVCIPSHLMAYFLPRSTLLRQGVTISGAVWDPGFQGTGQALLSVHNPYGWNVQQFARIGQLVFHRLDEPTSDPYHGSYQDPSPDENAEVPYALCGDIYDFGEDVA